MEKVFILSVESRSHGHSLIGVFSSYVKAYEKKEALSKTETNEKNFGNNYYFVIHEWPIDHSIV